MAIQVQAAPASNVSIRDNVHQGIRKLQEDTSTESALLSVLRDFPNGMTLVVFCAPATALRIAAQESATHETQSWDQRRCSTLWTSGVDKLSVELLINPASDDRKCQLISEDDHAAAPFCRTKVHCLHTIVDHAIKIFCWKLPDVTRQQGWHLSTSIYHNCNKQR
jgi:hypothetical protein